MAPIDSTIINEANPHTIKKFDLIEKYVNEWAYKLLQSPYCDSLIFIDCMSNSGEYKDNEGKQVFGTPVRVSKLLCDIAPNFKNKQIDLYFSDLNAKKVEHLKELVPKDSCNFRVHITNEDGNELIKRIGKSLSNKQNFLLVYDPYEADIDWNAIAPFINKWGEIILNHMVHDPVRGAKMAKKSGVIGKYEQTYMMSIQNLVNYGSDKKAYEKRIEEIIVNMRNNSNYRYFIAAFPFFNEKNVLVYNLIHCTSILAGFKLYKRVAWKTFGNKSSMKNTHGMENQLVLDYDGKDDTKTYTDEYCYYIKDIAEYLQKSFNGKKNVSFDDLWRVLDEHPVFPSDGFKKQIKNELKKYHGAIISGSTISFISRD